MSLAAHDPIFIDLETRSACDLPLRGGWNYSQDPTTSLLTVSWAEDPDSLHLWLPHVTNFENFAPDSQLEAVLGEYGVVNLHCGPEVPESLVEAAKTRPFAAHNAWTFDQLVWERIVGDRCKPIGWLDTYPLSLACGLPGSLDQIAKRLWGEGKYQAGNAVAKKVTRCTPDDYPPTNVIAGQLLMVAKYNLQDVRLLRWLWDELCRTCHLTPEETQVLTAHRFINRRGVCLDEKLLRVLIKLSGESVAYAVEEITKLTDGYLSSIFDLRSRIKVFAWLDRMGVKLGTSLAKAVVQQFIDDAEIKDAARKRHDDEQEDDPEIADESSNNPNLMRVVQVLQLRMSALRVTEGKLVAAMNSVSGDGRVRGMFAYWAAHTGRWAGRRLQVHNLPTPKPSVPVWDLIAEYETTGTLDLGRTRTLLDACYEEKRKKEPTIRRSTPDDAASALIRSMIVGGPKKRLLAADYAAIECRVLAWLAGEESLLRQFREGRDPYSEMATRIFGSPPPHKKHPWRQVGKVVVLGCGYQLGQTKFAVYAAGNGIDLESVGTTPLACIEAFRGAFPFIAGHTVFDEDSRPIVGKSGYTRREGGFWSDLNLAAIRAIETKQATRVGRLVFSYEDRHLVITLPSKRRLVYRNARVTQVVPWYAKNSGLDFTVDSVVYQSPRYALTTLYGGKIAENVVQAVARDFIAHAMVRCEKTGELPIVLHVHDEPVAEVNEWDVERLYPRFMEEITTLPPWADGMILDAEGGWSPRYAKSPPPGVTEQIYRNGRYYKDA